MSAETLSTMIVTLSRQVMEQHAELVEAKLRELVDEGIAIQRIRVDHFGDPFHTTITIDDIAVADFKITFHNDPLT